MDNTALKKTVFFVAKLLIFIPLILGFCFLTFPIANAKDFTFSPNGDSAINNRWVDSVFATMSPNERIGQLFMVEVSSKWSANDKLYKNVETLIKDYHIGGVLFFYGGPNRQAEITNKLQSISKIPLFISQDAEWGLGMRLDSTISYSRQLSLGAIEDDEILYETGLEIARQCKRLGVNIDFAPCVDIYDNPGNSVIVNRSFGSNKLKVANKAFAVMSGMQDGGLITTAKHFPGHGNTVTDSHADLPIIKGSKQRIDTFELFPFKHLINNGIKGVMVGHLFVEAYEDSILKTPASISHSIISDLLCKQLKFNGLVFTDALAMKGISKNYNVGEVELKAFQAGVDVFLQPKDCIKAFETLCQARDSGLISQSEIDRRCKKVLLAKKILGLDKFTPIDKTNLYEDLNNKQATKLQSKIVQNAITLIKNDKDLLPLKNIAEKKIAAVSIGKTAIETEFEYTLRKYTSVSVFNIAKDAEVVDFDKIADTLKYYDVIVLGFHDGNPYPSKFGFTQNAIQFAEKIAQTKTVILDLFNNPMSLTKFPNRKRFASIIISYDDTKLSRDYSGQMIFGGLPFKGQLPIDIDKDFYEGLSIKTESFRLGYLSPEDIGVNRKYLVCIDSMVNDYINQKVFPGCQIIAAVDGQVFLNRQYGYFEYDSLHPVRFDDVYDLASVTKITSTVPALMKLYDEGKFDPNKTLGYFLPEVKGSNKENIFCRDILLHQAKLQSWLPVANKVFKHKELSTDYVSTQKTNYYNQNLDDIYYISDTYKNFIKQLTINSSLNPRKEYLYSDVGMYLMQWLIENQTGISLNNFVEDSIYSRIGANYTYYNPVNHKIPRWKIAPTEFDNLYRKHQIQGYVQDFGAALMGGIAGHAGLFSNANDLAKIMQTYLNGGCYGGDTIFKQSTIQLFTQKQENEDNRRGLGFDKNSEKSEGPASYLVSPLSFGHTGFSGTFVWADPKYKIVFVLLANRVFPNPNNNKFNTLGVRKKIQTLIYQAIFDKINHDALSK